MVAHIAYMVADIALLRFQNNFRDFCPWPLLLVLQKYPFTAQYIDKD